ncbi:hypothetical protein HYS82_03395 [Candidatus Amesbacteria bacterium]|nr:hypothetical protein [Candidatus Amesbacteria bacterium]
MRIFNSKNKFYKIVSVFLILLILSVIGFVTYIRFSDYRAEKELSDIPTVEKWPIYNDSRLGLSFKYPPGWLIKQAPHLSGYPNDYYILWIIYPKIPQTSEILIESTNDKDFRNIQIDRLINDGNGKSIIINDLKFIQAEPYYFYLDGKASVRFQLLSYYSRDGHSKSLQDKMLKILNHIIYSIEKYPKN